MRTARVAATATVIAASLGLAPVAASATTTPPDGNACSTGAVPADVAGAPPVHVLGAAGDYIWHDSAGWHLRVTHPDKKRAVFAGTITATAPMTFRRARLEEGDAVKVTPDRRAIAFLFGNYGGVDGIDVDAHCAAAVRFAVTLNGHPTPLGQIYLGHTSAHPGTDPFVIRRSTPATT